MKNCQNSWRINSWAQFSGAINLKKVDTKENTGTLKVALRPQREMVDKPSSGLDEIQLRTQQLQNKLDQVYTVCDSVKGFYA